MLAAEAARPRRERTATRAPSSRWRSRRRARRAAAGRLCDVAVFDDLALSAAAMPLEAPPPEEEVASSSDAIEVLAEEGIGQAVAAGRSHTACCG